MEGRKLLFNLQGYNILLAVVISTAIGIVVYKYSSFVPVGLVAGLILAVISFIRIEVLIAALIFFIPLQAQVPEDLHLPMGINIFNILFLLLVITWVVRAILNRERLFKLTSMSYVILLYVGVIIASMVWSTRLMGGDFFSENINPAKRVIFVALLFFPIANSPIDLKNIKRLAWAILLVSLLVGVWAIRDAVTTGLEFSEDARIVGPFGRGGANDLSAFFVYYAPLALGLLFFEKKAKRKPLYLFLFLIPAVAILVTYSRGAYIGLISVVLFIGIVKARKLLVLVLLLTLTLKIWVPAGVKERTEMTRRPMVKEADLKAGEIVLPPYDYAATLESSSAQRIRLWRGALAMIKDHPVFGVGFSVFPYQIANYAPVRRDKGWDTHQMYLRVACEMGLIGLGIFLLLWVVPFKSWWNLYRRSGDSFIQGLALGAMAGIVGIAVVNFFGSRFVREELVGLYFILAGLMDRINFITKESEGSERGVKQIWKLKQSLK